MKILLIEDNPADVAMIREMLPDQPGDSFQIINERTLSAGLDALSGEAFDFILLDMGLPDSVGIETVQAVIRHASHKPVVVLTGLDDESAGMQSLHEGAQDYLVKGQITGSTLIRSIRYAQERSRIEQELIRKNADLDAINEALFVAGEELQQSEQRLKRSQEIAHLGSWEFDLTGDLLTWSDEVYRIFGLEPQEFGASYEAFLESVHPDDRAAVDAAYFGSVREGKDCYEIEHRVIRRHTGEVRYVHEKCDHIRDMTGTIVRSVGMVHDITERKMAEEENLLARKEWERTFDSVPDLIAILDKERRIIRANRAMAERLGTIPDHLTGQFCFMTLHESQCPPAQCPHEMTCRDMQQHVVEMYEPKLGGDFLVSTTPLFDKEGKAEGVVHVARDITKRRRAEMELEQYAERLKLSNQDLERFAYVASHDLREPLRMVTSFAQLLSERYKGRLDADADEFIDYIVDGGRRMDALVNDLLDYSRVTSRSRPMEMTDMNEPVNEALNNLSISIKERGARISVDRLPQAMVDRSQMTMVFQNLISNSMKFCKEDVPEIYNRSFSQGDEVVFSVSDNGIGIDPEYHQKIFEIFQRLHTRGRVFRYRYRARDLPEDHRAAWR